MKKQVKGRKFGRKRDQRNALMRHLAYALIKYERIETTQAKAKELRPFIEKWITKSRNEVSLGRYRLMVARMGKESAFKMKNEIAPRYKNRAGGYTRITKRMPRKGDAAKRAIIEFVKEEHGT